MTFNVSDYLISLGLDDLVSSLTEAATKSGVIISAIDTSSGDKLPNDAIVSEAYSCMFRIGAILNQSFTVTLEMLVEVDGSTRSHKLMKDYNLFYQYLFSGYLKPLNQIIAFHENRL